MLGVDDCWRLPVEPFSRPHSNRLPRRQGFSRPRAASTVFLAVTAVTRGWSSGVATNSNRSLSGNELDAYLAAQDDLRQPTLVMFHVAWCEVCQRALPEFQGAIENAASSNLEAGFATIDCTHEKGPCLRFGVKSYPVIKLFEPLRNRESPRTYQGNRTLEGFSKYVQRMTGPKVQELCGAHYQQQTEKRRAVQKAREGTGVAPLQPFKSLLRCTGSQLVVMLQNESLAVIVASWEHGGANGTELPAGLESAADQWRDRHLFLSAPSLEGVLPDDTDIEIPSEATLLILSSADQQWSGAGGGAGRASAATFYTGSLKEPLGLVAWVENNRFPGVWRLDHNNFYDFTRSSNHAVIVVVDPSVPQTSLTATVRGVAARLRDHFQFGVIDGVAWEEALEDFHIYTEDLPRVLLIEGALGTWVEDAEALRVPTLEHDLRAILDGAPLLRQGRGFASKFAYYQRETGRMAIRVRAYGSSGPLQGCVVAFGFVVAGALVVIICVFVWILVRDLCELDEEPEAFASASFSPPEAPSGCIENTGIAKTPSLKLPLDALGCMSSCSTQELPPQSARKSRSMSARKSTTAKPSVGIGESPRSCKAARSAACKVADSPRCSEAPRNKMRSARGEQQQQQTAHTVFIPEMEHEDADHTRSATEIRAESKSAKRRRRKTAPSKSPG